MPLKPDFCLEKAGGIAETFLTAYQLLHLVGEVKSTDCVLVHAAGSGVGTSAIQLGIVHPHMVKCIWNTAFLECNEQRKAKLNGNKILATAGSQSKLEIAKSLGALEGVNYKEESFSKKFSNVDFILDCIGGSYWKDNMKVLAQDGKIILYGLLGGVKVEGPLLGMMLAKRAQIRASTLMSRSPDYKANLVNKFWTDHEADFYNGNLYPLIDKTFLFTEIADAHHYMAQNQNCGKIILKNNF